MKATTRLGSRGATKMVPASTVKTFVLDTNVLLHDPRSLFRFSDNNVVVPVEVLEELDHIKSEQNTERGRNAREVTRTLAALFPDRRTMQEGARLESGGSLMVVLRPKEEQIPEDARRVIQDEGKKDNLILRTALFVSQTYKPPVVLVTKDTNMQLKARAIGLNAEDYRNDRVAPEEVQESHATVRVSTHALQRFASTGRLDVGDINLTLNEYLLLEDESTGKTMPARVASASEVSALEIPDSVYIPGGIAVRPRNLEQRFLLDALLRPEISMVAVRGKAGTGKTLLAIAAAINQVMGHQPRYSQVNIARAVMPLGKDIGFLPGSIEEKMRPWVQPYHDALEVLIPTRKPVPAQFADKPVGKKHRNSGPQPPIGPQSLQPARKPYEALLAGGLVNIEPLTYIRGRSIPRSILILDESQQLTPLEVKTVATRMAEGSKLVLIGDPDQIDNPYVDRQSNGLVHAISKMKGERFFASVHLTKGERSKLADAAAEKL